MGSIRRLDSKGTLFLDFRYAGQRLREYTALADTPMNRKRLQKALDRVGSARAGRLPEAPPAPPARGVKDW